MTGRAALALAAALLTLAAAGCARSENAGNADPFAEGIARNDLDQAASTERRREEAADESDRQDVRAAERQAARDAAEPANQLGNQAQ